MTAQWLIIPPPPSVNALFSNVAGKGRVRSAKYKQWATAAGWKLQSQRANWPALAEGQPYAVALRLPMDYRCDIDNAAKGPLDLLVSLGIVPDDKHLVTLLISKTGPRLSDAAIMITAGEVRA
jgi:Holliday junction resolvase RusA-like endonuclease